MATINQIHKLCGTFLKVLLIDEPLAAFLREKLDENSEEETGEWRRGK